MSTPKLQEQHGGGRKLSAILPDDLLAHPHWVGWRYEQRAGQEKPTKPPIDPATGDYASSDNPTT